MIELQANESNLEDGNTIGFMELLKPNTKIILLWNKWYGNPDGMVSGFGFGDDMFMSCPVSNCRTSNDRRLLNYSSAVMFHMWPDFNGSDLPGVRWPHQRYIMNFFEPPARAPGTPRDIWPFNEVPDPFFNWTFTYRRDSDIPSNIYGDYHFIKGSLERNVVGDFYKEESLDDFYGVNITGKTIMAAWFSSHCPTQTKREDFAFELAKHIRVDIYGKCGGSKALECRRAEVSGGETCDDVLAKDYLFYLALENCVCQDYVSEKFYRGLRSNTVPIVFGGAHYSRFAPPHSYINAFDFKSPKELADYLVKLSENRRLYSKYFQWKRHFRIVHNPVDAWCSLCEKLNDPTLPPKVYANVTQWWYMKYPCKYEWHWSLNSTAPQGL